MNRRLSTAALLVLCALPVIARATPDANAAAQSAAQSAASAWLKKLDAADYAATWHAAAALFKGAVSAQAWQQAAQQVRGPLGALRQRADKSISFTRALPGVPDGQYVVIQFDTRFENKASSVETVTVALDPDGGWRVAGYFIN